jgi:DNA adenine methylase
MDSSSDDDLPGAEPAPEPFLKWAGGKRQLLEQFERHFPPPGTYGVYHEPFLGGGAVFFHLRPARAVLSDLNSELVEAYQVVRDDVEEVIRRLRGYRNEEAFYYEMRGRDPQTLTPSERVARMLYLNRTCFNGLYRLNSSGRFNVPFGRYRLPRICRTANLRASSRALAGVELRVQPFEAVLECAQPGDFVYLDPPYQPLSRTASFTAYTRESFDEADQRRLAEVYRELDARGCRLMLSNSHTELVHELYRGFRIVTVQARRNINSRGAGRGPIDEALVLNRPTQRRRTR